MVLWMIRVLRGHFFDWHTRRTGRIDKKKKVPDSFVGHLSRQVNRTGEAGKWVWSVGGGSQ